MSQMNITSNAPEVAAMFTWAQTMAQSLVITAGQVGPLNVHENNVLPSEKVSYHDCYWAGYGHRSAYYLRDFAHQAVGAQLLGLRKHNKSMLSALLATATNKHRGWPVWALNFDGVTPISIDYRSSKKFVREVPAIFEMVELIHQLFRWTGDTDLLAHKEFWQHTMGPFVAEHDTFIPNGVAEGSGKGIFDGAASFNEFPEAAFRESGDAFGAQYAATRHAAALADAAGDRAQASAFRTQAQALAQYFRDEWSHTEATGDAIVNGWTVNGDPVTRWGRETTFFMPLKGLFAADPRSADLLAEIQQLCLDPVGVPPNVEALTYLPDLFLRHGDAETAWYWMTHIFGRRNEPHVIKRQGANGTYPEVSFTLISHLVGGLLGLRPNAAQQTITTTPILPKAIGDLEVENIPFATGTVTIVVADFHTGGAHMWLENNTTEPVTWRVGHHPLGQFLDPHLDEPASLQSITVEPGQRHRLALA